MPKRSPHSRKVRPRPRVHRPKGVPFERRKHRPRKKSTAKIECDSLRRWILDRPSLASAITWESAAGVASYAQWTTSQQGQLCSMYRRLRDGIPLSLADPPANQEVLADNDPANTTLAVQDAWLLYLATVANSLLVERTQVVNWSMLTLPDPDLRRLLDGRAQFAWSASKQGYELGGYSATFGLRALVVPGPPDVVLAFMSNNGLIGADPLETLGLVLEWCRANLAHFYYGMTAKNAEDHWQYRGLPPVTRILAGTTTSLSLGSKFAHWTAGCHGTNGFLIALLRVVNIPVEYLMPAGVGHATPYFPSHMKYLSHGDDPYNRLTRATPPFPASKLLIDQPTYVAWFGNAVPVDGRLANVGRQVGELSLKYLPDYLLCVHCSDVAGGCQHSACKVANLFAKWYSPAALEALGLWAQLDAKIAALGGCPAIPGCGSWYIPPGCN